MANTRTHMYVYVHMYLLVFVMAPVMCMLIGIMYIQLVHVLIWWILRIAQ